MANALKLIIPLLDDSFKLEDFSEQSGFVDAYLQDINRPALDNHIFLLYDGQLDTVEKLARDEKIRKMKSLYKRYTVYISGMPYLLYVFACIGNEIPRIKDGKVPYKDDVFMKIQMFWHLTDGFINSLICMRNRSFETNNLIVPEEDYIPSIEDELNIACALAQKYPDILNWIPGFSFVYIWSKIIFIAVNENFLVKNFFLKIYLKSVQK